MARTSDGRRRSVRGAAVVTLLLAAACAPSTTVGPAAPVPPSTAPPGPSPAEEPAGDGAPEAPGTTPDDGTTADADGAAVPGPCDPAVEAAVAGTVAAQLDALAVGDFAAAYAWASPFFRTVVDPDRFTTMIRTEYPELLDVASRRLEGCNVLNRRAVLVVALTAGDGARRTLAYELGESEEGWRIDGAYDVAPREPAPEAPEV